MNLSKVPTDRLYKKSYECAKHDEDVATVGISDFAKSELGDIVLLKSRKSVRRLLSVSLLLRLEVLSPQLGSEQRLAYRL